jgi:antitoxin MazE
MVTTIQKWGNSQGLRFPKSLLEEANISVGDEVTLSVKDGKIIVEPADRVRGRYNIKTLVAEMPADYTVEEIDWGPPVGQEEW